MNQKRSFAILSVWLAALMLLLAIYFAGRSLFDNQAAENTPTSGGFASDMADGPTATKNPDPTFKDRNTHNKNSTTSAEHNKHKINSASNIGAVIKTNDPEKVSDIAIRHGLHITKRSDLNLGRASLLTLAETKDNPAVLALAEALPADSQLNTNYAYRALYTQTNPDTHYASQWNLSKINAPAAWDITTGNQDTVIAVVDTGVLFSQTINGATYTQPDFPQSRLWMNQLETGSTTSEGGAPNCSSRGLMLDKSCNNQDDDSNGKVDDHQGWDFMGGFSGDDFQCPNHIPAYPADTYIGQDNDPQPYSCDSPDFPGNINKNHYNGTCSFGVSACFVGHGTMVGSVAAAASNNGQLITGIDQSAKVMNLRVLDGYGFTTTDLVADAVDYAANNGANVINLSLAVSNCDGAFVDPVLESVMQSAKNAGVVVVAASGNENGNSVCYPASSPHAIAVGSSDQNDQRSSFSNQGKDLDVIAPGSGIPVANAPSANINNNYYASANGTSLATPHVAGLAGLLKGMRPSASAEDIRDLIVDYADIVPAMDKAQFSFQHGYGRINLANSVRVAKGESRPIFRLTNPGNSCQLLTSSPDHRRYVEKIGYRYENIDFWEPISPELQYRPRTTNHTCN